MGEPTSRKDLPTGWKQTLVKDVCEIVLGQSPPSETYNTDGIGLPFFQGKAEFKILHPIAKNWCSIPGKIAEENDILLSVRAPVGDTNIADRKCCIGRGLAALRFNNHRFLFYYLRSIENELDKKGTGSTFKAISGDIVENIDFPLPPLPEQHRIVAKIEELFSELDEGVEALKTAQQQLKVYRQAVLQRAFEGKLTSTDVVEGELPKGWNWVKIDSFLADKRKGMTTGPFGTMLKKSEHQNSGVPVLGIENIGEGVFQMPNKIFITDEKAKELSSFAVSANDIIISRSGTVGEICSVSAKMMGSIISTNLIKVSINHDVLDHFRLEICM